MVYVGHPTNLLRGLCCLHLYLLFFHQGSVENATAKAIRGPEYRHIFVQSICASGVKFSSFIAFSAIFILVHASVLAQTETVETCMDAQVLLFPLSENDFSTKRIEVDGRAVNAVYYVYQDKYTFWYKLVFSEDQVVDFSVQPSVEKDRYGATAYRYGGSDFCERFVNQGIDPIMLQRAPMFSKDEKLTYLNRFEASAGDTIYLAVLSLNPDDCGHYLYVESGGQRLSVHAIHRPCYQFAQLDAPDFKMARMGEPDVQLYIEDLDRRAQRGSEEPKTEQADPEPAVLVEEEDEAGFSSLSSVVVESADDDLISVGDRLVLNQVFFYNNTYALKPEADDELQQLLQFLRDNPSVKVEIEGHSANYNEDIRPDPNFKGQGKEWNFKGNSTQLSEMRAKAVRSFLIDNGIHKKRLKAVGYGDTRKRIVDAKEFEEHEKNMRVEVLITAQ